MAGRKNVRLKNFDYRNPGYYFITICTCRKQNILGSISEGEFFGNRFARLIDLCWKVIPDHYPNVKIGTSVIMPNHFHGLLQLLPTPDWNHGKHPLGKVVNAFKGAVTRQCRENLAEPALTIWQRGYYEHVVRDEIGLDRIREYIANNPIAWDMDRENPSRTAPDPFDMWLDKHHPRP